MKRFWIGLFIGAFLFGVGLTTWFFLHGSNQPMSIRSTASVIKEIKSLGRLETTSFTIEQVVDAGSTQSNPLQQFLFGDKLLMIAHGEVIAGFDLTTLTNDDIKITGTTAQIHLPPAQILVSKLDNSKTRVYDRQTGVLTKGSPDLESQARSAAEQSIRAAACEARILEKAEENVQSQLATSLHLIGVNSVSYTTSPTTCL